jgi:hypothetical protein
MPALKLAALAMYFQSCRLLAMPHMKKVLSDLNCIKKISNLLLTNNYS